MTDPRDSGARNRVGLDEALDALREVVAPVDQTEPVPVTSAVGRVLAEDVELPDEFDPRDHGGSHDGESTAPALAAGHRLRETDLAFCRAANRSRVAVTARPTVGVVSTDLSPADGRSGPDHRGPESGDDTGRNGLTVATLTERWGGKSTLRDPFESDRHSIRAAIERDLTKDLVVVADGTVADERDLVPSVVDDLGELVVEGIALEPGQAAGFGVVRDTPVFVLPGDSVASLVAAVHLVRPAIGRAGRLPRSGHPKTSGRLASRIESEEAMRTVVPVAVEEASTDGSDPMAITRESGPLDDGSAGEPDTVVRPVRSDVADPLAVVAAADGWVTVPEAHGDVPAGETVTVADWEFRS